MLAGGETQNLGKLKTGNSFLQLAIGDFLEYV